MQSDKDCLVILDDVWSVNDVAVFDHLSGKCQLLITTRDAKVVRGSKGFVYELQFMAVDKSRALLYQSAGVVPDDLSTFSPEMHQIVEELLNQCRGLPLALSLVGSNLIDTRLQQDWEDVLGYLQKADLELLHSQFPNVTYPYDNILAAIDASFRRLEINEREKFLDFGIFPEDINIASDILELFWSSKEAGRTSYSPQEGRCILKALERKSLIQKGTWGWEGGTLYITKWQVYSLKPLVYMKCGTRCSPGCDDDWDSGILKEYRMVFRAGLCDPCMRDVARLWKA